MTRALCLALTFAGLGACEFSPPVEAPDDGAWLEPWTHRKAVTLLASEIEAPGNGALDGFPVLVSVTDPQLGATALASGDDLVFTADDGTTLLATDLESFSASGELVAWVKVPSLSATVDTTLYVYYGHATPPARTPEAVWTDHAAVWHLGDDPGPGNPGEIRDATSGSHDGTADGRLVTTDSVAGQIGRGIMFDDEFLQFGQLDTGNTFTISMWIRFAGGSDIKTLIANSASGRDTDGYRLFVNSFEMADSKLVLETGNGSGGSSRKAQTAPGAIPIGTFAHVAAVVDRSTATAMLVVNGESVAVETAVATNFKTNSDLEVARMKDTFLHFPGALDQVEVSRTQRSIEWLRTAFRNQSRPDAFHRLGPEQLQP